MHTGTSASAPLAAGIFALVLQAKYDADYLAVRCSTDNGLRSRKKYFQE